MDPQYNSQLMPLKSLNGGVSPAVPQRNVDPVLMRYLRGGGAPITPPGVADVFSSPSISKGSGKSYGSSSYGRSLSPMPLMENAKSPSMVLGDDVLMMDGVLVASAAGRRVSRSMASDSGGSSSNSGSASATSSSSSSGRNRLDKKELCMAWEDSAQCRYGSKCQFAHGKEELRPTRFPSKNKTEARTRKSCTTGSCSHGPNHHLTDGADKAGPKATPTRLQLPYRSPSIIFSPESSSKTATPTTLPEQLAQTPTATKPRSSNKISTAGIVPEHSRKVTTTTIITSEYWSPQDDGIEVPLPSQTEHKFPTRKDVDAYIENALYGPSTKLRLPVFTNFSQISDVICLQH